MNLSPLFRRLCIAACALSATVAWADPPGRVGRITYLEGNVSFYSDPDDGWEKAQINYPVTSENSLWTEGRGRAEVRVGPSAIRISDDTIFDFVKLQDDLALGFLQRGSLNVRIRQFGSLDAADRLQVDTSEGRFIMEGNGRYRLDASANGGESRLSVFSGTARFEGPNRGDARLSIDAGKQLTVRMTSGGMDLRYDNAAESPFDRWAETRDMQWDQTHTRYARFDSRDSGRDPLISPYMTGYEELDAAGDWIEDNEYGRLWTPRVVVSGWAPYRYGRWSYVRPWGWTWIDDAPWGFAPFHYGRWVQVRSRWCWWPGPYVGRPVYAPALVAWIGSGGGSLTISSGPAIGWFPLAPREYYVPRYTTNPVYLRRINYVTNNNTIINPPTRYRNQVPGVTIVANNVFINGRPVGSHTTHLPPGVVAGQAPHSSFDMPRPNRRPATQMPDRRQESQPTPAPAPAPGPRPRFTPDNPREGNRGTAPAAPGQQTPKYRSPENSTSGPFPVPRTVQDGVPGSYPGQASVPGTSPVQAQQPRSRSNVQPQPQPQPPPGYTPPPSHPGTVQRVAPIQVEPAPAMPDREVRPAPRQPNPRSRPQPETPYSVPPAAIPVAPPVSAPRPQVQQPVAPQIAPVQPKVTPAPSRTPKPQPDAQDEVKDGRGRVKPQKD